MSAKKLQLLRSLTNSHAQNRTSIIIDAAKYIQDLKQKVAIASAQNSPLPVEVSVEGQEKGFQIRVVSEKNYPDMLTFILEAIEDFGLEVLHAKVSCSGSFHLEAIAARDDEMGDQNEAQAVKEALAEAIIKSGAMSVKWARS